jgi:hypothetical protein
MISTAQHFYLFCNIAQRLPYPTLKPELLHFYLLKLNPTLFDTNKYLREYAALEHFYVTHSLKEMSVQHRPLREILYSFGNDALAITTIEQLMKYRQFEQSVEALASLKDFGYKSKHTKKIQKKIGQMMSLEETKRNEKIAQSNRLMDKYENDKWFKYLIKSYKKNLIKWNKLHQ